MKVRYRANGEIRDVSDEAARSLIEAHICDAVDAPPPKPPKGRKAA